MKNKSNITGRLSACSVTLATALFLTACAGGHGGHDVPVLPPLSGVAAENLDAGGSGRSAVLESAPSVDNREASAVGGESIAQTAPPAADDGTRDDLRNRVDDLNGYFQVRAFDFDGVSNSECFGSSLSGCGSGSRSLLQFDQGSYGRVAVPDAPDGISFFEGAEEESSWREWGAWSDSYLIYHHSDGSDSRGVMFGMAPTQSRTFTETVTATYSGVMVGLERVSNTSVRGTAEMRINVFPGEANAYRGLAYITFSDIVGLASGDSLPNAPGEIRFRSSPIHRNRSDEWQVQTGAWEESPHNFVEGEFRGRDHSAILGSFRHVTYTDGLVPLRSGLDGIESLIDGEFGMGQDGQD